MRRAIFAVLVTAVGLVLLLGFKPHEITASADRPSAVSQDGSDRNTGVRVSDDGRGLEGGHDEDGDGDGFGGPLPEGGPGERGGQVSANSGTWTGAGAAAGAATGEKVATGNPADTRWGPVQVELVLSGGTVTGIKVLQAPDHNHRDIAINDQALPILNEEALSAQSARIDTVSGATYTSEGYIRSLQSALDKAGL
ncbi:FMN-binding protein [Streptosporangium sp. NPDC051022]|uniref:FMN-binding protein n=1 Tax=Streptosporangium sp. NPDC051022 TaxID=3155752 RepID=UPI003431D318